MCVCVCVCKVLWFRLLCLCGSVCACVYVGYFIAVYVRVCFVVFALCPYITKVVKDNILGFTVFSTL